MRGTAGSVAAACAILSALAVAHGQAPQNQPTAPNPTMCEGQPGAAAAARGGRQQAPGPGPAAPVAAAQPQTPRDVTVTAIAGVVAAGAKFTQVWQTVGNN